MVNIESVGLQDFWVKGSNAYELRDELKSWGCVWDVKKRLWKVYSTSPDDYVYKAIKRLGCQLVPVYMSDECKKIQDILFCGPRKIIMIVTRKEAL